MTPLVTLTAYLVFAMAPKIDVVYPRPMPGEPTPTIDRVDSNFIFGSVQPPSARLTINDYPVQLSDSGAFLAFLPVNWKTKTYRLVASLDSDSTRLNYEFTGRTPMNREKAAPKNVRFPVKLKLTGGTARNDPNGTYYVFLDSGTVVTGTEWRDGYYRTPLYTGNSAWIPEEYAVPLKGAPDSDKVPVVGYLKISVNDSLDALNVPVGKQVLYRIWDEPDMSRIVLEMYGVVSHIDQISFPSGNGIIRDIRWSQPYDRTLKLTVSLNDTANAGRNGLLGYRTEWEQGNLVVAIRHKPAKQLNLNGWRIALDPGHGGTSMGSIGPMRHAEKDINLTVALELKSRLEAEGAQVVMTRDSDRDVSLEQRIIIAKQADAQILLSIHHNALPDGRNPFDSLGTGIYYYHPQSRTLAALLGRELVNEFDLPDEGLYYKNLAVCRPTGMIAVLVEGAYMMLPEQEQLVTSPDYARRYSDAVIRALYEYVH